MVTADANVLIYATGARTDSRHLRAVDVMERMMRSNRTLLTLQSLGEFSTVALRKYALAIDKVASFTTTWRSLIPVHSAQEPDLASALEVLQAHRLQFWDAMLWATARRLGVRYLLTEDFQDGRTLDGVTFINPFAARNDDLVNAILPA